MSEQSKEAREAQEVWVENSAKAAAANPFGGSYNYYKGIKDFKQALKAEIEKRKEIEHYKIAANTYSEILELIETCKP